VSTGKAEATPGPWTYERTGTWPDTNHDLGIYSGSGTGQVAKVEGYGFQSEANAALIAAAPDLYEALSLVLGHINCTHHFCDEDHHKMSFAMAQEALAKARVSYADSLFSHLANAQPYEPNDVHDGGLGKP
jgi:hypothetical protein